MKGFCLILFLLLSSSLSAQLSAGKFKARISFRFDSAAVDSGYRDNRRSLAAIRTLMESDAARRIDSIAVVTYATPDGNSAYNLALSRRRATAVKGYLIWKYPALDQWKIYKRPSGESWETLRSLVANDTLVPYHDEVMEILASAESGDVKSIRLEALHQGIPHKYLRGKYFSRLGFAETVFYLRTASVAEDDIPDTDLDMPEWTEMEPDTSGEELLFAEPPLQAELPVLESKKPPAKKIWFAVKTNLLYDLAITPNIELEIPIGKRWSINAEYQYAWWLKKDNTFCWQIEAGGIEGRYWFGDREKRRSLTGWFAGLFTGGGMYDFQLKKDEGRQGEFYLLAGLSGGYAMPVARNLNLEFSAGVAYILSDYRRYRVVGDQLIKQGYAVRTQSIFPAKAKISLVWTIGPRQKKGGAR